MNSKLNPYLSFNGAARDAMEFYKSVFGGELTFSAYKDSGMPHDEDEGEKIMHGMLVAENGITIMGADAPKGVPHSETTNISLSLSGDDESELTTYFDKLSAGGTVREPLVQAPWGDTFGMLTDKFGTEWMVNITGKPAN